MNNFCSIDDPNLQVILDELRSIFTSLPPPKSSSATLRLLAVPQLRPPSGIPISQLRSQLGIPVSQHFVGRTELLQHLHDLLTNSTRTTALNIVSVYAAGGFGKTQLALMYLRTYTDYYDIILEVDGTSEATCCASFLRIRVLLGRHDPIVVEEHREWSEARTNSTTQHDIESECAMNYRLVKGWLSRHQNLAWLLFFDNVDDFETFKVEDFFPQDLVGNLLITSRRLDSCEWSQWRCMRVSELHRNDSRDLFWRHLSLDPELGTNGM